VRTPDFTEGVAAFLEKREAAFTGAAAEQVHPVRLVVQDDLRRWRLTVLLRWLLALPHLVLASAWLYLALPVAVVNWVIVLALGRVPKGMRDLMAYCLRYSAQTYAYLLLLTDRYPTLASGSGFQFEEG